MSCPLSCRGCPVQCPACGCPAQCPTRAVMSNVQQGLSCPMSNSAVMSIVQCPTGLSCPLSNVQQGLLCPMSNRGCHVQCPTGAVMSIIHDVMVLSKFQQCHLQWNISISIACELCSYTPFECFMFILVYLVYSYLELKVFFSGVK